MRWCGFVVGDENDAGTGSGSGSGVGVVDGALFCVRGVVEAAGGATGGASGHVGVLCVHTAAAAGGRGGRTMLSPYEALAARRAAAAVAGVFAAAADAKQRQRSKSSLQGGNSGKTRNLAPNLQSSRTKVKITEELGSIADELGELNPLKREMEAAIESPDTRQALAELTKTRRPDGAVVLACYLAFLVMRDHQVPSLGLGAPGTVRGGAVQLLNPVTAVTAVHPVTAVTAVVTAVTAVESGYSCYSC
jgi:hypothetical protein